MIVTTRLSLDIVRYLNCRTQGVPLQWTALGEIADHVYGPEDLAFNQAVDLARCRGWIMVEGKSPSRRVCLTKAGCSLFLSACLHSSASCQPSTDSQESMRGRQEHGSAPVHQEQKAVTGVL